MVRGKKERWFHAPEMLFLTIGLAYLSGLACVDLLSLENRPCPCLEGYQCWQEEQTCIAAQPCTPQCQVGQFCYYRSVLESGLCEDCSNNKHCGLDCTDCTQQSTNWACLEGICTCRYPSDCPIDHNCTPGKGCQRDMPDAGFDAGAEAGVYDVGVDVGGADFSLDDQGTPDGGDSLDPICANNKSCGLSCKDCTQEDTNWACINGHCGCYDSSDCLPYQTCKEDFCILRD